MKKTLYILTGLIIFSCTLFKSSAYKLKKDNAAINYANTITSTELKEHLYVIASDEYEGRETGRKGQQMTAEYIKKEFIKYGIKPGNNGSYFQYFPLIEKDKPETKIKLHDKTYNFIEDFYFFERYASFNSFDVSVSEIVSVEYGIINEKRNDYKDKNVLGRTVVINVESPSEIIGWDWRKKIALAKKKGAKNVLFISSKYKENAERLSHFLSGTSMKLATDKKKENDNIPFIFISQNLAEEIFRVETGVNDNILKINPLYNYLVFEYLSSSKEIESSNVLGLIEGSDPKLKNEIIILTAHYDHLGIKEGKVYNGADDDGTGTVALLEIAQALQKAKEEGKGPKRSVLIMPVSGEEKGLLGSRYYIENPVFPIKNTVANLNIDMIGRLDENHNKPNYVYVIGGDKISQELSDLNQAVADKYTKLKLDYTYNDENDPNRFYYRSDHYNFAKNGIPVIFYFSGVHEDYHKHTDEVDKIMFDKVEKITRLVFHTAWELSNKPKRLEIDKK